MYSVSSWSESEQTSIMRCIHEMNVNMRLQIFHIQNYWKCHQILWWWSAMKAVRSFLFDTIQYNPKITQISNPYFSESSKTVHRKTEITYVNLIKFLGLFSILAMGTCNEVQREIISDSCSIMFVVRLASKQWVGICNKRQSRTMRYEKLQITHLQIHRPSP
jgi:hypothetical protein